MISMFTFHRLCFQVHPGSTVEYHLCKGVGKLLNSLILVL